MSELVVGVEDDGSSVELARNSPLIWLVMRSVIASTLSESSTGIRRAISAEVGTRCINVLCVKFVSLLAIAKGVLTLAVFVVS